MGDVDVGEAELVLELEHQLEDLRPDAHVEHRDRLVGDEHVGVEDDRPRQHGPLLLPAGEVGRVLVEELLGRREADPLERRRGPRAQLLAAGGELVEAQRVGDERADRQRRVERGVRVLEDDLHPLPQRPQLRLRCGR